ncbi:MAG: tyrosine-type recombinase/integrase [Oscillospiraceae bacterium]|nr:MAG: Telomere resolvase [Bacteriophage sp.]
MECIKCKKEIPAGSVFCCWCGKKQEAAPRKALKRANGTGTVYKLQGRRTRPWVAAKGKTIIGYFGKKTAALEALARLQGRSIDEIYNWTFKQVYVAWKDEHFRDIGVKGTESYERAYDVFEPLHDRKFRELRTADYQSIMDKYRDKSHSLLSKFKQLATQMSQWGIRQELITTNFASFIKLPENVKKEKEIFSKEDIQKLESDGSQAAKLTLMMVYTGMRIGELFGLRTENVHETYVIGGEKTEAGRNRIIPIRSEGRKYFAEFKQRAKGDLLISGYDGQKLIANFRNRDFYPLLERLGISKKTPHATRHTFASWAVANNIKPELLQKMLGHADYSTTANIYEHFDIDQLVNAIDAPVTNALLTNQKSSKKEKP